MREPIHPPWTQLTEARKAAGLSRNQLALKAGLARSYIGELESGHKLGRSPEVLRKLARALRVPQYTLRRPEADRASAA